MSMYPLATSTLTSAGTFNFTNIPQTFTHLQVRLVGRATSATTSVWNYCQFNGDSAGNYAYGYHTMFGDGASATGGNGGAGYTVIYLSQSPTSSQLANVYSNSIIDIYDYTNTNKYKTTKTFGGYDVNGTSGGGTGIVTIGGGLWKNTAAINRIYIANGTGDFAAGTRVDIYGISTSNQAGA